jgi:hypothetical protein
MERRERPEIKRRLLIGNIQPIEGLSDAVEQEIEHADLVPGGPDHTNQPTSCSARPSQSLRWG